MPLQVAARLPLRSVCRPLQLRRTECGALAGVERELVGAAHTTMPRGRPRQLSGPNTYDTVVVCGAELRQQCRRPGLGGSDMAIEDWDLNLFTSDPTLLERASDEEYERAAAALDRIADPRRLRLLHALSLGEDTAQRAAMWAGIEQSYAERELAALALSGVVERRESPRGPL